MDSLLSKIIHMIIIFAKFSKSLSRLGIGNYEEWSPGKKIKLLLVGYNGARNTGADARVVAAVKQIKELFGADNIEISVITLDTENLAGYFDDDVKLLKISSIFLKDLYRACSSHHAAILCEGSTLKSTFANALSLFFCEASGIMAKQKKPCIAFGSEVGKMDEFLRRFASKVCRSTYFITRTKESQEMLTGLGLKGHVGTDTAWTYDDAISREKADELLMQQGWDGQKPLLGIAAIDPFCWPVRPHVFRWIKGGLGSGIEGQYDKWYFYSKSAERTDAFARYIGEIAKAVNRFTSEHDYFPVFLGMERMDVKAFEKLRPELEKPCAVFLSGECSADIMAGVLGRLSALVTSRYHASVLSMKEGCPIVAVSMDERLNSLMAEVGLEDYLHSVREDGLGDGIYGSLEQGVKISEEIVEGIHICYNDYQEKQRQMGEFLKEYILDGLKTAE